MIIQDFKITNLALQRFHNKQVKEGDFTCFYHPKESRDLHVSVDIYFLSEGTRMLLPFGLWRFLLSSLTSWKKETKLNMVAGLQ